MKLLRHSYLRTKTCSGQASKVVHTIIATKGGHVELDTSGWWTLSYMDKCFKPYNKIHIGGE